MNNEVIVKLNDYFFTRKEILIAVLYGSQITERYRLDSDVDIAVAKSDKFNFDELCNLQLEISKLLNKEIDIVDIQSISGVIHYQIMTTGKIIKKNTDEAVLLYHYNTMKALYWYEDYYPIYSREQQRFLNRMLRLKDERQADSVK